MSLLTCLFVYLLIACLYIKYRDIAKGVLDSEAKVESVRSKTLGVDGWPATNR
jgi:hypothetical protein